MKRIWNLITNWKAWVATLVFAGLVWFFAWFIKSDKDINVKILPKRNMKRNFVDA